jgi:hypothetical protein
VVGNLQTLVLITVDQVVLHEDLILEILNKLGSSQRLLLLFSLMLLGLARIW